MVGKCIGQEAENWRWKMKMQAALGGAQPLMLLFSVAIATTKQTQIFTHPIANSSNRALRICPSATPSFCDSIATFDLFFLSFVLFFFGLKQ